MREDTRLTREQIFDDVRATLAEVGISPQQVQPEARLVDDLELDSLDWIDLALRLEEKLPITLRDEKLAIVATVQHVVDLVHGQLSGADGAQ